MYNIGAKEPDINRYLYIKVSDGNKGIAIRYSDSKEVILYMGSKQRVIPFSKIIGWNYCDPDLDNQYISRYIPKIKE